MKFITDVMIEDEENMYAKISSIYVSIYSYYSKLWIFTIFCSFKFMCFVNLKKVCRIKAAPKFLRHKFLLAGLHAPQRRVLNDF